MPSFHYKAVAPGGAIEEGRMDGADEGAVIRALQAGGYLPIRASRTATRLAWQGLRRRRRRIDPVRLTAMTHDLAVLLRAGLTLDHALRMVGDQNDDADTHSLVMELETALRNGASLSAALQERPDAFPRFYIALVRAGEAGGNLEPTLTRLHDYLQRSLSLRHSVRSALIYPALLVTVALVSVAVLLAFVIPQFAQLLADSGQPVPPATRVVLFASDLLRGYWWALPLTAVAAAALLRHRLATPAGRAAADRLLLRLPVLGDLIRQIEVARFARALGTLLQNGVPLLAGVSTAAEVFANRILAATVPELGESLKQGRGLAGPMLACGQFPRQMVQLVKVGEESGQLDVMLVRVADLLDAEVGQRIQRLMTLLEPALIVALGIVIAGILFSILSAILGMNDIAL